MSDTQNVVCKTKYLYLEMILNKTNKYDVVAGLFRGIVEFKDSKFILLNGLTDSSTNVLNLKYYNIMTIEEMEDGTKNMAFCMAEASDQKDALNMVQEIYSKMLAAGFGLKNDPEIIDLDKYSEVPVEYKEGKTISKATANSGANSGVGSFAPSCTSYKGNGSTYSKSVQKKEPEPKVLSRSKGKKPNEEAMAILTAKLDLIWGGTYEAVLPETKEEDKGDPDTKTGYSDPYGEDDLYEGYGMGMGIC